MAVDDEEGEGASFMRKWKMISKILCVDDKIVVQVFKNTVDSIGYNEEDDYYYILIRFICKLYTDYIPDIIPMLKDVNTVIKYEKDFIKILMNSEVFCILPS